MTIVEAIKTVLNQVPDGLTSKATPHKKVSVIQPDMI